MIDPDCRLTGEIPTAVYVDRSFPELPAGLASLRPRFRVIPAAVYRGALRTDRSHMRAHGEWLSEPPPWPAIGRGTNLMRFVDMEDVFLGEIMGLDELRSRLAPPAPHPNESR